MDKDNLLFTLTEASDILKIHKRKIRTMIQRGLIPAIDVSLGEKRKRLRIRQEDLNRFIKENAK